MTSTTRQSPQVVPGPVRGVLLALAVFLGAVVGFVEVDRVGHLTVDSVAGNAAYFTLAVGLAAVVPFSFARAGRRGVGVMAMGLGITAALTLGAFGHNDSSTSAFVFIYWWLLGPVAGAAAAAASRRRHRRPPSPAGRRAGSPGRG